MWRGRLRDFRLMVTLAAAHALGTGACHCHCNSDRDCQARPPVRHARAQRRGGCLVIVHQGLNRGVCDNDLARHEVIVEGRFHGLQRDRRSSLERCVAFAFPFVLEQPGLLDLGIVLQLPLFVLSAPVQFDRLDEPAGGSKCRALATRWNANQGRPEHHRLSSAQIDLNLDSGAGHRRNTGKQALGNVVDRGAGTLCGVRNPLSPCGRQYVNRKYWNIFPAAFEKAGSTPPQIQRGTGAAESIVGAKRLRSASTTKMSGTRTGRSMALRSRAAVTSSLQASPARLPKRIERIPGER